PPAPYTLSLHDALPISSGVDEMRKRMRELCPKGSSRIHMKSVDRKTAPKIVTEVAKLNAESRLYVVKSRKLSEREARDLTLTAADRKSTRLNSSHVKIS